VFLLKSSFHAAGVNVQILWVNRFEEHPHECHVMINESSYEIGYSRRAFFNIVTYKRQESVFEFDQLLDPQSPSRQSSTQRKMTVPRSCPNPVHSQASAPV
jgi:hypothetical protein